MNNNKITILVIFTLVGCSLVLVLLLASLSKKEDNININVNNQGNVNNTINNNVTISSDTTIDKNNRYYHSLIVDNVSVWYYQDYNWQKGSFNAIDGKLYTIYVNNQYHGKYTVKYLNSVTLFSGENYVRHDGKLIGFTENFNIKIKSLTKKELDSIDLNDLYLILNRNIYEQDLSSISTYYTDINNDGSEDKVVCASNLDSLNQSKYFNVCYAKIGTKIYPLINENVKYEDVYNYPIYTVEASINVNDSTYNNIILQKQYYSMAGETGNIMYAYSNGNYVKVIED